ncbi:UNVERIFIED_CONTAM: hypothetical protein GTU68_007871, partial [Idotea baltica]|nr:hypothetical protein [Idotea baltica]
VNRARFVSDRQQSTGQHIYVCLDAKDGVVAIDGWAKLSKHNVIDLAQHFEEDGVHAIIYTDIARDGMMQGVNIDATKKLAEAIRIPVIASGGVTNMDDLVALQKIEESGVSGVITGRAIYEGTLDFAKGQAYLDELEVPKS